MNNLDEEAVERSPSAAAEGWVFRPAERGAGNRPFFSVPLRGGGWNPALPPPGQRFGESMPGPGIVVQRVGSLRSGTTHPDLAKKS